MKLFFSERRILGNAIAAMNEMAINNAELIPIPKLKKELIASSEAIRD